MVKLKKLSQLVSKNDIFDNIQDLLWDENIIFDKGFYLEIYLLEGIEGKSLFKYINVDIKYSEFISLGIFNGKTPKEGNMFINVIPSKDNKYSEERRLCSNIV